MNQQGLRAQWLLLKASLYKMQCKLTFIILLILILSNLVYGLGVSPGKFLVDFKPNLTTSFEMGVYNYPAKNQDVDVYVSYSELDKDVVSEFRNVISLEKTELTFTQQEGMKTLNVSINLPQGFSKAGVHELRVGAMPSMRNSREGVSVVAGNEIRVLINVSAEYASDKFAKIKRLIIENFNANDVKEGEKSNITLLVKSESDETLTGVFGVIKVLRNGTEIATLKTENISLEPQEEKTLKVVFNTGVLQASTLILTAEVFYDSKSEKANGVLNILGNTEKRNFPWWWILIILLLIIIIILLIIWLRRKEKEEQSKQPKQSQQSS